MIITVENDDSIARIESGEKGYSLYCLSNAQIPVPEFFIIGKSAFNQFQEYSEIRHIIDKELNYLSTNAFTTKNINNAYLAIRKEILAASLPADLKQAIRIAYESLNSQSIAIRSSIITCDQSALSFAGHHSSFLSVSNFDDAVLYLKECWISAFCPSAIRYRLAHKQAIRNTSIEMAVIFQKMFFPSRSGMLSTSDLHSKNNDIITINATYGLSNGIISGKIDYDICKVNKLSNRITLLSIINKKNQFLPQSKQPGFEKTTVPVLLQSTSCLSFQQIVELAQLSKKIENRFNKPQIIEWVWNEDDGFQIIQTSLLKAQFVQVKHSNKNALSASDKFDNITYPLTFSFKRQFYYKSYLLLCKSMGISEKETKSIDPYIEQILNSIFGRIYFNVLNIYRLTSLLLPSINQSNNLNILNEHNGFETLHIPDEHRSEKNRINISRQFQSFITCAWYHFRLKTYYAKFRKYFEKTLMEYTKYDFLKMSSNEIYKHYLLLEKNIFSNWTAPSINDCLSIIYFKIFRHLTYRWFPGIASSLEKDLLLVNNKLSSESVKEVSRITDIIRINKIQNSKSHFINNNSVSESEPAINHFQKNVSALFSGNKEDIQLSTDKKTDNAEKIISSQLKGIKLFIYNKVLFITRKSLKNRDVANCFKSRIYGIVNTMFKGIGENLAREQKIDNPDDVFYLELEMLQKVIDGSLSVKDLRNRIKTKQEQYDNFKMMDPPNKIITGGPIYWLNRTENNQQKTSAIASTGKFQCTGISSGVSEGKIINFNDAADISALSGKIAVAKNDDQSIANYIPLLSGLIIPNTFLYSHCAIIAREFGIPVISGLPEIIGKLSDGITVRIDGTAGLFEIIANENSEHADKQKHNELIAY